MGPQGLALGLCFCAAPALEIKCRPISSDAAARRHALAAPIAAFLAALIAALIVTVIAAIA